MVRFMSTLCFLFGAEESNPSLPIGLFARVSRMGQSPANLLFLLRS
jgi:hypothetical protein